MTQRDPRRPSSPGRSFRLLGQVDHVSHRIVRGWAWSPDMPRRRLQLDIFYQDVFLGRISTGQFRPDLRQAKLGDGRAGFIFHLPADVPDDVEAADLCIVTAGPARWTLPVPVDATDGWRNHALPTCHRRMLGPFLAGLRDRRFEARNDAPGRRPRIETLCAPAGEISAFVEHIALKYERPELALGDTAGLWRWYLGTYAMERGPRRAPLSRDDIDRLTRPLGWRPAFVTSLFANEIGAGWRVGAAYRWAIEAGRRLFVEDCLVAPRAAANLRAVSPLGALTAYPLSAFMRKARREIAILASMPIARPAERRRVYALFMILALRDPHLLMYLPGKWLHRLMNEPGLFEATQAELFGADMAVPADRYRALVAAAGLDLVTQTFRPHFYDGHRVRNIAVAASDRPVDVQIFGPLSRRLGLGESGRRIAAALGATPFSLNVVDYDLRNASRTDHIDEASFGPPRAARLNILHLNAEEIPEALAYLPDVFSQAALVAIPYWELSRPAAVHRLGLRAVDEVWVASHFLADVFADPGKPVHRIGMSCDARPKPSEAACRALRARYGLAPETFVFLTTSDALSWVQRKNPLGVVEAFAAAFPSDKDVALVVKTQNLDGPLTQQQTRHWTRIRKLCDADPRITLIDESFDSATQRTLLAACDGFVSLHRAEGLGLDAIDALDLGRAVVATAYSGTLDLCTPETSWPVAAELVPVAPQDYCFVEDGQVWAEPDALCARDALLGVVRDRAARERRIEAGQTLVREQATVEACARRIEARVRAILQM